MLEIVVVSGTESSLNAYLYHSSMYYNHFEYMTLNYS